MSARIPDHVARQLALAPDRSFCVLAPAGSGKTELLTQRLLKLLTVCEQPEQILAITFTRKAAGEMQHRLLASLRVAAETPLARDAELSPHELASRQLARAALAQDQRQGWNLLQNPQRLRLTTIDAFTSYLTSRLPFAANFGARPELTTDTTELFKQAVHATLAALDNDEPAATALGLLLPHLHNNHETAEKLLLDLLRKRADWLPVLTPLASDPDSERRWLQTNMHSLLIEQLTSTRAQLLPFQSTIMELVNFVAPYLEACGDLSLSMLRDSPVLPPATAAGVPAWQGLAQLFLKQDGDFRIAVNKRQGFIAKADCKDKAEQALVQNRKDTFKQLISEMQAAGTLPAWQSLQILPPDGYSDSSWPVIAALLTLLPRLAGELHIAMRAAGKIDHVETSLAALTALGSEEQPTDLALRLDYQLRHILVDEFQDTSHTQFQLLEKLTAGWQPGDGRTLFIVGDGMQSCYLFRNADVSLFLRARDAGIGSVKLEPLQLSVNFRSNAGVVDWVNAVFTQAFPARDDVLRGGVSYSTSEASKLEPGIGVRCLLQYSEAETGDKDDDSPSAAAIKQQLCSAEADAVADLCRQLQHEQPDASIAILVRNRSHLSDVVQALRQRGLRWNASEIDRLLSYQEIADLHSLLRALLNIADITAWLALLRSPLVGLALADLELLATHAQQQQRTLWSTVQDFNAVPLSADAQQRLQRCLPALQRGRRQWQQMPLSSLLELVWLELGGGSVIADKGMLPNVAKFFDLVEQHSRHGDIADIHGFEERLERTYGSAADTSVKLEIMTIHKAKGLQFDNVILCGLHRASRSDTAPLLRWQNFADTRGHSRLLLGLKQQRGGEQDPLYDFLAEQEKVRAGYELTRLLYIGVTRAVKAAWLFGTVKLSAKTGEFKAPSSTLLNTVLPTLLEQADLLQVKLQPVATPPTAAVQRERFPLQQLQRLPANWVSPLAVPLLPELPLAADDDTTPDEYDNLLSRTFGELVHLGLKQVVEQGSSWLERSAGLPLWRQQLARVCAPATLDEQLQELQRHLCNHQQSEQGRWLFSRHQQDVCELPLLDYRSGYRRSWIIDRSFVDADGVRWIVDYKTAMPATGQSQSAFLAEQGKRYAEQLTTYRSLLAVTDPATADNCRLALYFTGLDLLHPVA